MSPKKRAQTRSRAFLVTLVVVIGLLTFLLPLFYGMSMSVKSQDQMNADAISLLPRSPALFHYQDQDLELYSVPLPDGTTKSLAALQKGRQQTTFIDPSKPDDPPIEWKGAWRTLAPVKDLDPHWSNFAEAWKAIDFLTLLKNTAIYAALNTIGIVFSSSFVAYGFARFRFKGKGFLFLIVMATMILPPAVTLIPTYAAFNAIGWVGTWLPLIVPAFFANAYNVFLFRQFFMGIPYELDEAAKIDGASPIRTLYQIILPMAIPAIIAVGIFNFFYCWNDYFAPLVYLAGKPSLYPISVGLGMFNGQYSRAPHLIQAASLLSCVIPVGVFFLCQRFFMQGIVVTGVEK